MLNLPKKLAQSSVKHAISFLVSILLFPSNLQADTQKIVHVSVTVESSILETEGSTLNYNFAILPEEKNSYSETQSLALSSPDSGLEVAACGVEGNGFNQTETTPVLKDTEGDTLHYQMELTDGTQSTNLTQGSCNDGTWISADQINHQPNALTFSLKGNETADPKAGQTYTGATEIDLSQP